MIGTPPPILYVVIPCYNEELVLPATSSMFLDELLLLVEKNKVSPRSRILYIDDGSTDTTWNIIQEFALLLGHIWVSQQRPSERSPCRLNGGQKPLRYLH